MSKNEYIRLINKETTIQIDYKSWSEILLFLSNRGWKPDGLLSSFLGNREVSSLEAKLIKISGQNVLDQAIQAPLSIYPLNFDMGKLAEIVYFCEEGAFRIS